MKITTAAEMREIDRITTEKYGVPSPTLMENAGTGVAQFILERYPQAGRITVVCGKGNNGGDGFVVARKLHDAGRVVELILLGSAEELKGDAAAMFARLPVKPLYLDDTSSDPIERRGIGAPHRKLRSGRSMRFSARASSRR